MYIVYKGVSAYGQCGKIGPTYASLTFSYDPSEISTFDEEASTSGSITYADLFSNCTARAANYTYPQPDCTNLSPSCISQDNSVASLVSFDQLHCYPYLNYPNGLQAANPAWFTYVDTNIEGHFASVFDPPRALTPAPALVPIRTKNPSLPGPAPASHATDPTPSKTTPPVVIPISVSGTPSNPSAIKSPLAESNPPAGNDAPSEDDPLAGNDPPAGKDSPTWNPPRSGNGPKDSDEAISGPPKDVSFADPQPGQAAPMKHPLGTVQLRHSRLSPLQYRDT